MDAAGIARAHLVGNSLGGWITAELAAPGRALSVAAICPGRPVDPRARCSYAHHGLELPPARPRYGWSRSPSASAPTPSGGCLAFGAVASLARAHRTRSQAVSQVRMMAGVRELSADAELARARATKPEGLDRIALPLHGAVERSDLRAAAAPGRSLDGEGAGLPSWWSCLGSDTCRCPTTPAVWPRRSSRLRTRQPRASGPARRRAAAPA